MKSKQQGFTVIELILPILYAVGFVGWIWNIVKIWPMVGDPITGMFIFRIVGIFAAPLGAILGYL